MRAVSDAALPAFDYTDPTLGGDRFHEVIDALRAESWIASSEFGYVVLDRDAVDFFLRSRSVTFPAELMAAMFGATAEPRHAGMARSLLTIDGEEHASLRQLLNPSFTPREADAHRPAMRRHLGDLWATLPAGEPVDVVRALCRPYPARVIATRVGLPEDRAEHLHDLALLVQRQFVADPLGEADRIDAAAHEVLGTVEDLLDRRAAEPAEDLLTRLAAVRAEGELDVVACTNLVVNLLIGGVETVQGELAHLLRMLSAHPEEWAALRADPAGVPAAVEEALRIEPSTPFTARVVREDLEYRGMRFPAGTVLLVGIASGNRDGVEGDPAAFAPSCPRGARPMTFGAGRHFCLGSSFARAELEEALAFLVARVERVEPAGRPRFEPVSGIYGMRRLPLLLHRA